LAVDTGALQQRGVLVALEAVLVEIRLLYLVVQEQAVKEIMVEITGLVEQYKTLEVVAAVLAQQEQAV
jgi:hypothetical protein